MKPEYGIIRCSSCASLLGEGELIYQAFCGNCNKITKEEYAKGYDVRIENFNRDKVRGEQGEQILKNVLEGRETAEIKTQYLPVGERGEMFIEVEWNGKPSGLSTSKADWYIYMFNETKQGFIVPTIRLKEITKYYEEKGRVVMCGDGKLSKCVLVPLTEVW